MKNIALTWRQAKDTIYLKIPVIIDYSIMLKRFFREAAGERKTL
jgi:hypothetical protein